MKTNLNDFIELHITLLNLKLKDALILKDIFYFNNIDTIKRKDNIVYISDDDLMENYAPCMFQFLTYLLNEQYSE